VDNVAPHGGQRGAAFNSFKADGHSNALGAVTK